MSHTGATLNLKIGGEKMDEREPMELATLPKDVAEKMMEYFQKMQKNHEKAGSACKFFSFWLTKAVEEHTIQQ